MVLRSLLLSLAISGAQAQEAPKPLSAADLAKKADEYLSRMAEYGFMGAVLIAKDGKIVLEKGYGFSDVAAKVAITPNTVFDIGSLTKQFVAATILRLEEQGKLSTSDPISKHLDGVPEDKQAVTIHQLLSHTSGLPYMPPGDPFADVGWREAIQDILKMPLIAKPGEKFGYSNPGYSLLAAIVEKRSGKAVQDALAEMVFKPAGMSRTGWIGQKRWPDTEMAHAYTNDQEQGSVATAEISYKFHGAGGVITCVGDMYKWDQALMGSAVLSDASKKKLFSPNLEHYGYGWNIVETLRKTKLVYHAGDYGGFNAEMRRYVDEGLTIILLSNKRLSGGGSRNAVMNPLAQMAFGMPFAMPPSIARLKGEEVAKFAGSYRTPAGGRITARTQGDKMILSADSQDGLMLLADPLSELPDASKIGAGTKTVANAMAKGDAAPMKELVTPAIPYPSLQQYIASWASELKTELGEIKSIEVIGAAPVSANAFRSFARFTCERGARVVGYTWLGGTIGDFADTLSSADLGAFVTESATGLASFDLFSGRIVRLTLSDQGLVVRTKDGDRVLPRVG